MADEFKLQKDARRAAEAQQLLDSPLLNEAYTRTEADLVEAWIGSQPRDADGRERLWNAVQANRKHKDFLQSVVNNGKIAEAELKALRETAEHKKRFGIL